MSTTPTTRRERRYQRLMTHTAKARAQAAIEWFSTPVPLCEHSKLVVLGISQDADEALISLWQRRARQVLAAAVTVR